MRQGNQLTYSSVAEKRIFTQEDLYERTNGSAKVMGIVPVVAFLLWAVLSMRKKGDAA